MVMFAVDIKVLFRRVKKYFHHEGQEGHEEKLIFVFFLSFEVDINVKRAGYPARYGLSVGHR